MVYLFQNIHFKISVDEFDQPVFLREAEGGLHVRAHLREHRVLDGDTLHPGWNLTSAQRITKENENSFWRVNLKVTILC